MTWATKDLNLTRLPAGQALTVSGSALWCSNPAFINQRAMLSTSNHDNHLLWSPRGRHLDHQPSPQPLPPTSQLGCWDNRTSQTSRYTCSQKARLVPTAHVQVKSFADI